MGGLCCCVDTKLSAGKNDAISEVVVASGTRHWTVVRVGKRFTRDPCLFDFVWLLALTEFLILRGLQLDR
jgi:hypothetical protein